MALSNGRRQVINERWRSVVGDELHKPYWSSLQDFLTRERSEHEIYPPQENVFAALDLTSPEDVRVVIVGQDPYHGPGQAHGLSFSVPRGVAIPPSLRNIFTELHDDLGIAPSRHGNLESWARQGVLLLNATLTVRSGEAGSHRGYGWETFTDAILGHLGRHTEPLVFVLWGSSARSKRTLIHDRHTVIESAHPSPLSAHRGFFGSRVFSQINQHLARHRFTAIDWRLPE
jgi:uracil-DNA glycosylase